MVDIFKQIFVVVTGILLVLNGFNIIKKGHFEVGIGGRAGARPLISIPLKGNGARIAGIYSVISGIIVLFYIALIYAKEETGSFESAFSIGIVAIFGLVVLGLVIGFVERLLINSTTRDNEPR